MENQSTITPAEITTEFIATLTEDWESAAKAALEAADLYLADVQNRQQALAEQAKQYETRLREMKDERKKLAATVNDLSSRCDFDAAEEVEVQLETLDKDIASMSRKVRLVSAAELKGDPNLYRAAEAAHDAAEAHRQPYRQQIGELRSIVKEEIKRLEAVDKELYYAADRNPGQFANNSFEKVDRHYRDLDRKEKEAAEQRAAEYKAAKANAGHTRYTYTG